MKKVVISLLIFLPAGFLLGYFLTPEKVKVQKVYEMPGNFGEICANYLQEERVQSCSRWEDGYKEGLKKCRAF